MFNKKKKKRNPQIMDLAIRAGEDLFKELAILEERQKDRDWEGTVNFRLKMVEQRIEGLEKAVNALIDYLKLEYVYPSTEYKKEHFVKRKKGKK